MKYLFFFKGQPLLLCCVCCKIAIQDFLRGLHKKNKKNLPFHRRIYRRNITRRYFTESCKKITGFCHIHQRIADGFSDAHTDVITDGLSHACLTRVCLHYHRRHSRRLIPTTLPTDHACLTRVRLHEYRRHFRRNCRRIEKFGGIFDFLVRISINFRRNYRQKLIALTAINFRR